MRTVQVEQEVGVEDAQRRLTEALGPGFRVKSSGSMLKVGRAGVVPSRVYVSHSNGTTTFRLKTSGLLVSRIIQAASINPLVRHALAQAYTKEKK